MWWGHPITSSLPSIDYFISLDDEVSEAAMEHYSEQLVRMEYINVVPLQTVGRPPHQLYYRWMDPCTTILIDP